MQTKKIILFFFVIGLYMLVPPENKACPIPVFRYALEYWEPDPYRVEVLYSNSLSPKENNLIRILQMKSEENESNANFRIRAVNIDKDDHDIPQSLLKKLPTNEGAYMVVRYPYISGINIALWTAELTRDNVELLLDSPVRKNLAGKLATDATGVWLFVESGDKKKDRKALNLLKKELNHLEKTLVLPDLEMWWNNSSDNKKETPLINFDIITISRDDPVEKYLLKMLTNSEADLTDFDSEPIVFPVFGRGIILYGIVGKGINEWNIREAAEFVTGECSCQAKLLNPGVDMLISMNWEKEIKRITDPGIANPLTGIGDFSNREEEARRLLESATRKRLGEEDKITEEIQTDPDKIIYLDIPGSKEKVTEIQDNAKSEINTGVTSDDIKKDKNQKNQDNNASLKNKSTNGDENELIEFKTKKGFSHTIILVFGIILVIILISGIAIYLKAGKK